MLEVNKDVVGGLGMIKLRMVYKAISGENLKAWIGEEEARKEIYNKVWEINDNEIEPEF